MHEPERRQATYGPRGDGGGSAAGAHLVGEEDESRTGEAGDALKPDLEAQEQASGEPSD
ncbi:hypothetical protein ACWV95_36005 [Streptomyces albus]